MTLLIFLIIFVVALSALVGLEGGIGPAIGTLVCGSVFGFLVLLIVGAIAYDAEPHGVQSTHTLVNLSDRMSVEGHFYLFGGTVEGVPQYAWYEETSDNTFRQFSAPAQDSDIHYILDDSAPHYVVTNWKCPHLDLRDWGFAVCHEDDYYPHYAFYVPKGSITNTYRLDAQ